MSTRRHDWVTIKQTYIEGVPDAATGNMKWLNQREVAELFNVGYNRLRDRSSRESWSEERAAYQSHLEKVRREERASGLAKEAVELDKTALTVAKMGMRLVQIRVAEITQAAQKEMQRKKAEAEQGLTGDDFSLPVVDSREIETLSRAATGWHALGGRALGEVDVTRTEITGAGGGAIELRAGIKAELTRDDPDRLVGLVLALERSDLMGIHAHAQEAIESGAGGD